jgi:uncharacterized membrane protein HdeD (DUF308 family)
LWGEFYFGNKHKGATMAKGSSGPSTGVFIGIIAIIAGVLVIWGALPINLVLGIFLIIFGILAFTQK